MPIHITMSIPTLSRYDLLVKAIETIAAGTRKPDVLLIIDNGGDLQEWLGPRRLAMPAKIFKPASNLGVGPSCNFAWKMVRQYYLHSNDDVEFAPECIQLLAEAAESNPEKHFFLPFHEDGAAFTVFLATKQMWNLTEGFDEQFVPAYYEDNDLGRRMNLQNIERTYVHGAKYVHFTSSTLKSFNQVELQLHHKRFEANEQRYIAKWGGHADKDEAWTIPYNGTKGHTLEHPEWWARAEVK